MTGVIYGVRSCEVRSPPTTAIPKGWRSSAPAPRPSAIGSVRYNSFAFTRIEPMTMGDASDERHRVSTDLFNSSSTLRTLMFDQGLVNLLAAVLLCLPRIANAQSGSAPAYRERELAQIIREAGYECSQVESITNAPAPPPGWESLRPEIV